MEVCRTGRSVAEAVERDDIVIVVEDVISKTDAAAAVQWELGPNWLAAPYGSNPIKQEKPKLASHRRRSR